MKNESVSDQSVSAELGVAYAQQNERRRAAGRYTLREASDLIETETGERKGRVLSKLLNAAGDGFLAVYGPDEKARYLYEKKSAGEANNEEFKLASKVRDFYEEVYWSDLNKWLDVNEPRIVFRFQAPILSNDHFHTTIRDERECESWLSELMIAHRNSPTPKVNCRSEAVSRWPKLKKRAFNRAWSDAVKATNATAWIKPGARPKIAAPEIAAPK